MRIGPRGGLALQWLLPALTTAVVTVVLITALVLSAVRLRRAAIERGNSLLDGGARQLAVVAVTGIRNASRRYLDATHDSAVHQLLAGATDRSTADSVHRLLRRFIAPRDTIGQPIELWTAHGRRVAVDGRDSAADLLREAPLETPAATSLPRHPGLDSIRAAGVLQIGALYASGGHVYFWLVVPVMDGRRAIGYLTERRRIVSNPQTERTLRELTGTPVSAYYGNADRGFWTSLQGTPTSDPRHGANDALVAEARLDGTPIVLALSTPRDAVLAAPNALVRQLAALSFALLLAGALVAWVVARRLTMPIVRLTRAAEAVAGGNYATRVPSSGPDEIARLAASFNEMAHRVEEALTDLARASRAKSDFLATMSHELRTPLNAIGGYVDLLELELRGPVTDAQRRDFARIRTNQQHLLGLINSVLDLSRIESGRVAYELEPIAVDPLLSGLDALVAPQAAAKELRLEYDGAAPDLVVEADREKLRQILLNLLSNAIRHTPGGGRITMAAAARDGRVHISVRDTGPGIAAERQAAIFEPFVQLDRSLSRTRDGVGLGLAISRDLAIGMSGGVTVESTPGQGACFTVSLPQSDRQAIVFHETGEVAAPPRDPGALAS